MAAPAIRERGFFLARTMDIPFQLPESGAV
jgi:hypothetical protein